MTLRPLIRIIDSLRTVEGGGFVVRRPFPTNVVDHIDPFLLLDEMGPADYAPGKAVGAPSHPHRGFETVTYLCTARWCTKTPPAHVRSFARAACSG